MITPGPSGVVSCYVCPTAAVVRRGSIPFCARCLPRAPVPPKRTVTLEIPAQVCTSPGSLSCSPGRGLCKLHGCTTMYCRCPVPMPF